MNRYFSGSRRLIWAAITFSLLVIASFTLIKSRSVINYDASNNPVFTGEYAPGKVLFDGELKIVTWNIAFAQEIEQALTELSEIEVIAQADVILLQEMDEHGVEQIAHTLDYNYVYYPASIHSRHDLNFGNAVLSKWPIVSSDKIILPHRNPTNEQIRIAVQALIAVNGAEIPVYSVHTETFWLGPDGRNDQMRYLAKQIDPGFPYIVAGGDFNTATTASLKALDRRFALAGLDRVSAGAGDSRYVAGVGFALDHIYARGMSVVANGVAEEAEASDHKPVWVILNLAS